MDKNHILYFPEVKRAAFAERDLPVLNPDEVLIRTSRTLISTGTEMTAYCGDYEAGSIWERNFSCPYYPGYNNIGTIVDAGAGVPRSWLGRRVATPTAHASFTTVEVHGTEPEATCFPVPEGIRDDDAVFFTIPLIVMNGIRRSGIQWGESAVVFGLGLLGQFAVRFLQACGAFPILAVDTAVHRLELLPQDPDIIPVNPAEASPEEVLLQHNKGRRADVVFELTGDAGLIPCEAKLLRKKGRLIILSSPKRPVLFDFHDDCAHPSIAIIGAHNYSHPEYPQPENPWTKQRHMEMFFDLLHLGKLDVRPLVSRRLNWRDAPAAYEALDRARGREMGIILDWSDASSCTMTR